MTRMFIILAIALGLQCCGGAEDAEVRLHYYQEEESIFINAMTIARNRYPRYFFIAQSVGIEDRIRGVQIMGKNYECVLIVNESDIIIEYDLPIFCFEKNSSLFRMEV